MLKQKKLAARVLGVGKARVKIRDEKAVSEALTRQDIRALLKRGDITKLPKRGTNKSFSKKRLKQKKKGRRSGIGSTKGVAYSKKKAWMGQVRPLRRLLRDLKENNRIDQNNYRMLYLKIKGGFFRNKKHLLLFLKEKEMLNKYEKPKGKK